MTTHCWPRFSEISVYSSPRNFRCPLGHCNICDSPPHHVASPGSLQYPCGWRQAVRLPPYVNTMTHGSTRYDPKSDVPLSNVCFYGKMINKISVGQSVKFANHIRPCLPSIILSVPIIGLNNIILVPDKDHTGGGRIDFCSINSCSKY